MPDTRNISLRLDTHCEVIDLHQDASVDLVVRYSLDDYPNLYGVCLFDESFGVYGSPEQVALRCPAHAHADQRALA